MKLPRNYASPLENTVRKAMYAQLFAGLESTEIRQWLANGKITGILAKGSTEFALRDAPFPITRNARDMDLIALGEPVLPPRLLHPLPSARQFVHRAFEMAGAPYGIAMYTPDRSGLPLYETVKALAYDKLHLEAITVLSPQWRDEAVVNAKAYGLNTRDIAILSAAGEQDWDKTISAEIHVALNMPPPDLPAVDRSGRPFTGGIALNDIHLSLLNKIESANNSMRQVDRIFSNMPDDEKRTLQYVFATDLADIYNLSHAVHNGKGLQRADYDKFESVIRSGENHRRRAFLMKVSSNVFFARYGKLKQLDFAAFLTPFYTVNLDPPSKANTQKLHDHLQEVHAANLLGEAPSRTQSEAIYTTAYELSLAIRDRSKFVPKWQRRIEHQASSCEQQRE